VRSLRLGRLLSIVLLAALCFGGLLRFSTAPVRAGADPGPEPLPTETPALPTESEQAVEEAAAPAAEPLPASDGVRADLGAPPGDEVRDSGIEVIEENHEIRQSGEPPVGDGAAPPVVGAAGWVAIMSEGFEGAFPSGSWSVFDDNGSDYGEYYWDDDDYLPHSGGWSAWPANGGADGLDPEYYYYPNNMDSWMVYGPFDLSDANDAELLFYYWNQSEVNWDWFGWYASVNGTNFYGYHVSGNSGGWTYKDFDLTNVPTIGDVTGDSSVWIAFVSTSDGSNVDDGPFVDDIVLQKYTTASQPNLTPYTPSGWDYPIVPSSVQGTHTVNQLCADQATYIDWAVINEGASTSTTFYTTLYFDGSPLQNWYTTGGLDQGYYTGALDWALSVTPTQGWHTLKIVADVYGDVSESNEGDNEWQYDFYWDVCGSLCGPYTQASTLADDMLIPDDGGWVAGAIHVGERPRDAVAGQVDVKYGVHHPAPEELEIRVVNETTGIAYSLWDHQAAAGDTIEETHLDIEAYRGQPVDDVWYLEMRDTRPGNAGTLDYAAVEVRYVSPEGTALYDASDDRAGREALLRLPAGVLEEGGAAENRDSKPSEVAVRSPALADVPPGAEIIETEDFEGVFPGSGWTLLDLSSDGCEFLWDDDDYRPHGGSWAGWPANGGLDGLDPAGSMHPPNMQSWMIYGPIDLSDATDAGTSFYLWLETEQDWDWLFFGVSDDGVSFNGIQWSGVADWQLHDVYYTDYVGDDSVWVAWVSTSDSTINYEGPWVDDIAIWKQTTCQPYDCGITSSVLRAPADDSRMDTDRSLSSWDVPSFDEDSPFEIRLKSGHFTPQPGISTDLLGLSRSRRGDAEAYVLLQLQEMPSSQERQALAELGVSLLRYVPQRAWIASVPARVLPELSELGFVRWIGEIHREDKIDPAIVEDSLPPWALDAETGEAAVIVQFMRDVSIDDGLSIIQAHDGRVRDRLESIGALVVWIGMDQLRDLASEEAIEWIEPVPPPYSPLNDCIREMIGVDTLHEEPYSLDGTGVDVLVYDAGTVASTHAAFAGRLMIGDTSGTHDHATHVAGTVGGDGTGSPSCRDLRGMAPDVDILSYGFEYDGSGIFLYTNPGDIEDDWDEAQDTYGADIGTASLGSNVAPNGFPCEYEGDYGATAHLLDSIVRGSLGAPYIATWANGNERGSGRCGSTYHTTAPPANAKNPIQVGATNSNQDVITDFSSWGPSDDGRLKPIVSAPGCESQGEFFINSTLPPNDYGESGYCGTSMATPAVAGVVALMMEQYRDTYSTSGRFLPSTAKAVLIHTAVDLANPGPDYQSGYGRVNAVDAVDAIANGDFREEVLDSQGEMDAFQMVVAAGTSELRVSLAWDDYPATLAASQQLVNDLDLTVVGPDSTVHYPWSLDPANPGNPATIGADHLNNQEQVVVGNPAAGTWTVRVTGTSLPEPSQSYSLVFPGAREAPPGGNPPNTPSNPSPADGATNQSVNVDLTWTGGDPDPGDTVTYDIYFEANDSTPDSLLCDDVSATTCDPGTLVYNTHYYWYVAARDAGGQTTTGPVWDFTTQCLAPGTPSSPAPSDNATGVSVSADLDWADAANATSYDVYFGTSSSPPYYGNTTSSSYGLPTLSYSTRYYWRVVAKNACGDSAAGPIWDFTTECLLPSAPTLSSPSDGAATCDLTPDLEWSSVSGATSYWVQVDNAPSFGSPEVNTATSSPGYTVPSALSPGTYYWRVRASNLCGDGPWSAVWDFAVLAAATGPPTLNSPGSGSYIIDRTPMFRWSSVASATSYEVQIDDDAGFGSPEIETATSSTDFTPTSPLATGSWYWRVRACNLCGESGWSSEWGLTILDRRIILPLCLKRYAP
jgi:hypothetical protein